MGKIRPFYLDRSSNRMPKQKPPNVAKALIFICLAILLGGLIFKVFDPETIQGVAGLLAIFVTLLE